eukprot:Rmarinus@m.19104
MIVLHQMLHQAIHQVLSLVKSNGVPPWRFLCLIDLMVGMSLRTLYPRARVLLHWALFPILPVPRMMWGRGRQQHYRSMSLMVLPGVLFLCKIDKSRNRY